MVWDYVTAMGLTLAILLGWIGVQRMYRRFAARHPEYGPPRECLGCGLACPCEERYKEDDKQITKRKNE